MVFSQRWNEEEEVIMAVAVAMAVDDTLIRLRVAGEARLAAADG